MQGKVQVEKIGKGSRKMRHFDDEYITRKKKMNKQNRKQIKKQIEL